MMDSDTNEYSARKLSEYRQGELARSMTGSNPKPSTKISPPKPKKDSKPMVMSLEQTLARNLRTLEAAKKALKDPKINVSVRQEIMNLANQLKAQNRSIQRSILASGRTSGTA